MKEVIEDWKKSFERIWEAIDQQNTEIESLHQENSRLKERIERLEAYNNLR